MYATAVYVRTTLYIFYNDGDEKFAYTLHLIPSTLHTHTHTYIYAQMIQRRLHLFMSKSFLAVAIRLHWTVRAIKRLP